MEIPPSDAWDWRGKFVGSIPNSTFAAHIQRLVNFERLGIQRLVNFERLGIQRLVNFERLGIQ
ncbi:hypothetical protein HAX54_010108, partial [Datura stramonium]|nr:hypothetical protein [Datura stramonium]